MQNENIIKEIDTAIFRQHVHIYQNTVEMD